MPNQQYKSAEWQQIFHSKQATQHNQSPDGKKATLGLST